MNDVGLRSVGSHNASRLMQAIRPPYVFQNMMIAAIIWLIGTVQIMSFSALIFNGRLAPYYGVGVSITLISAIILSLLVAVLGSDYEIIAYPQSTAVVLIGATATSMMASAPATLSDETLLVTVMATISFTGLLTGLTFLVLGVLHGGNLIRYIPYPIIGGFLAGSGWFLLRGAFNVMVGETISLNTVSLLGQPHIIALWIPGVILALVLFVFMRRTGSVLVIPVSVIVALILFYLILVVSGTTTETVIAQGWLIEVVQTEVSWQLPDANFVLQIDSQLFLSHLGDVVAVIVISSLQFLLNASGIELEIERELDLSRELSVTGSANALMGMLGGGIVGFTSVMMSTLIHRMGGYGRLIGVLLSILLVVTLIFGTTIISLVPRLILGAILLYLGLNFLVECLYDAWFRLPSKDYWIVLIIFAVIVAFGFLEGVVVGVIATIILFVVEYSKISVVKQALSGEFYRSNIDRSYVENDILNAMGQHILVIRLQGFIFFGTSYEFYQRIQSRVLNPELEALLYVVLDFRLVRGIDVSTVVNFIKLKQLAKTHGILLIFADVRPDVEEVMVDCGFGKLDSDVSFKFDNADRAMEWCENQLLKHADLSTDKHITISELFESRSMSRMVNVSVIVDYMERVEIEAGVYLAHQGEEADILYFIESGRVDIQLESEHSTPMRLRSMSAGTIIGEVGFYLGRSRSASIVVTERGVFHKLTRDALHRMDEENPAIAANFHTFIACVLAERLTTTNHMVQALSE